MTRGQQDKIGLGLLYLQKKPMGTMNEPRTSLTSVGNYNSVLRIVYFMDTFSFPYRHHVHFNFHLFSLMGCNGGRNNHLLIAY